MFKSTVTFLFHEDMAQEAMTAIPALPVILEAKYGSTIWGWFLEEAKEHDIGYYWDSHNGLKSTEDGHLGEVLGKWGAEWGSNDDEDKSASTASAVGCMEPFKIVTDATGKNQYYDDGSSVGTFKSTCAKVNPATHDFQHATALASPSVEASSTTCDLTATSVDSPSSSLTGDTWENCPSTENAASSRFQGLYPVHRQHCSRHTHASCSYRRRQRKRLWGITWRQYYTLPLMHGIDFGNKGKKNTPINNRKKKKKNYQRNY